MNGTYLHTPLLLLGVVLIQHTGNSSFICTEWLRVSFYRLGNTARNKVALAAVGVLTAVLTNDSRLLNDTLVDW
jgi:hypothetical protein